VVNRQAQIIAFVDDYWLLMLATLAVVPLLAVFRKKQADGAPKRAPEHAAME
jgi:MFS transporter, DHA2 family, multidrug resistance protein